MLSHKKEGTFNVDELEDWIVEAIDTASINNQNRTTEDNVRSAKHIT